VDRFPMFLACRSSFSPPVVTFSYVDPGLESLAGFVTHLTQYQPLFRELSAFRFLYISTAAMHFEKARELFTALVRTPLESDITPDLGRRLSTGATSATRLRELRLPRTTKRSSASSLLKR